MSFPGLSSMAQSKYKLLKLRNLALWIGYSLVAVLVYVCLTPNPPDTSVVRFGDKIAHFAGYALLFLWFAQVYQRSAQFKPAVALVMLGVAVEIAQSFTNYRSFEYADMLANTTGVIIGWLLAATPAASLLYLFEQHFYHKKDY